MGVAKGLLAGLLLALSTTASADITFPPAGIVAEPMKRQLAAGEQTLHAVRVDPRIFEAARPGQMLALPGTGGRPVLARHERGVVHDGGVRTWIGTVETATGPQRVVVTVGPDAVFGVIPQSTGPALQLTMRGGAAFLAEGGVLGAPARSDAVVLPGAAAPKSDGRPEFVLHPQAGVVPLVDVLVVYSPGVVTRFGSEAAVNTRLMHLEDLSNQAYRDSGSDMELRIVHSRLVDYTGYKLIEQALSDLANPAGTPLKSVVDPIRVQYGADLVTILRDIDETAFNGTCGIANVGGFDGGAFDRTRAYGAVVEGHSCPVYTFTHEIGHNMGSSHDQATLDAYGEAFRGHFPYSRGHRGPGFSSIMGYADPGQAEVGRLSNPRISDCAGQPCGIADYADNARSHANAAPTVSAYYATVVPVQPKLYIDDAEVVEGASGTRNLRFTVRLNQATSGAVTFDAATADGSASAGSDYTARSVAGVTIAAGQTSVTFDVVVRGDTADEEDETFEVVLSNAGAVKLADATAIGTIRNDDTTLSLAGQSVGEGDSGTTTLAFEVALSVPTVNAVTFRFSTADGSAIAGSDYDAVDRPAQTIPAGSRSAVFTVPVRGDLRVEDDEVFTVRATQVAGAKVGTASATVTIVDDDTSLSVGDVEIVEGDDGTQFAEFVVTSLRPVAKTIGFDYATVDGGARAGSDYHAESGTVVFPYGGTSMRFAVAIDGDTTVETDETFDLVLANLVSVVASDDTGTATIINDDDTATVIRSLLRGIGDEHRGIAHDPRDGAVYVADMVGNVVRRISTEGVVTIVAGRGIRGHDGDGGLAVAAALDAPMSVALDDAGHLYIGESRRIRRVGSDGVITTYAGNGGTDPGEYGAGDGGQARDAQLQSVTGMDIDAGGTLYFASGRRIRSISPAGILDTVAGLNESAQFGGDGGPAIHASLSGPGDVAVAPDGTLYLTDTFNYRVRHIDADGIIRTIAGDGIDASDGDGGPALQASLNRPIGLDIDALGNLYFVESTTGRVRRISRFGLIATVAGGDSTLPLVADGQSPTSGRLVNTYDVAAVGPAEFVLAQRAGVRRVGPLGLPGAPRIGIAAAGDGEASITFQPPVDSGGSHVTGYVVSAVGGEGTDVDAYTTAGTHRVTGLRNGTAYRFVVRAMNEFGTGDESEPSNEVTPTATALPSMSIADVTILESAYPSRIMTFTVQLDRPATDIVRFDAATADGTATAGSDYTALTIRDRYIGIGESSVSFTVSHVVDSVAEPDESFTVSLSDVIGATVVRGTATGTLVTDDFDELIDTVAGDGTSTVVEGAPAVESGLGWPKAIALDGTANRYVIDNDRVLRIDDTGLLTTFAGGGTLAGDVDGLALFAKLRSPTALAVDAAGNVYVSDALDGVVRRITRSGLITTVAGRVGASASCIVGIVPAKEVGLSVQAMAFDGGGNLYMADRCGVVRLTPWGALQRVAGGLVTGYGGDGGPATQALFDRPSGLAFDVDGDLLVADAFNFAIRSITPGGRVDTLYTEPEGLNRPVPGTLAVGPNGDVYFGYMNQALVLKLGADGSAIRRIGIGWSGASGDGGPAHLAEIGTPRGIAIDGAGNVFIADGSRRVRRVGAIRAPGAPTIGAATAGDREAMVAFSAPATDGGSPVTGYEVRSFPGGGDDTDAGGDSLVRRVTGLKNGTSYRFAARAVNAAGPGPWSTRSNAIVPKASALPMLYVDDVEVVERQSGTTLARFPVRLSKPAPAGGTTVRLATTDGLAVAGSDYVARTATLAIPAGETSGRFNVTVLGDTEAEPNETLRARVTSATGAIVADGVAVATIINDDVSTVSITGAGVDEGDEGTRVAAFTVSLDRARPRDVLVDVETANATATAGLDYVGRRVRGLLIPAGATSVEFPVIVTGDRLPEGDEGFTARITGATAATVRGSEATGTIRDDDGVLPSVSVDDAEVVEGDAGARHMLFTLRLSEPAPHEVAVYALTGDGDAFPGEDYVARAPTRLAFAPGQTVLRFPVAVNGDTVPEVDESFRMYVAAPIGATIADGTATGTIRDDEARIVIDDMRLLEGYNGAPATRLRVNVLSDVPTVAPISFTLSTRDVTATSLTTDLRRDFTAIAPTRYTIPAGASAFDVPVQLQGLGDEWLEPDESFEIVIEDVSGAIGPTAPARVELLNDDPGATYLSTIVGNGTAGAGSLVNGPQDIVADGAGGVYFTDQQNNRILHRAPDGVLTTIAGTGVSGFSGDGGPATEAQLGWPSGLAVDAQGNLYVVDQNAERIRRIAVDGTISTIAGNGLREESADGALAAESPLFLPRQLAIHPDGRLLFTANCRVRAIGADGRLQTIAGTSCGFSGEGGPATAAQFGDLRGMAFDASGALYVADYGNAIVHRIGTDGIVRRHVGVQHASWPGATYGFESVLAPEARIGRPLDLAFRSDGALLVSTDGNRVLQVTATGAVFPYAGSGTTTWNGDGGPANQRSLRPIGIALVGDDLYIADFGQHRIRVARTMLMPAAPTAVVATAGEGNSAIVTFAPSVVPEGAPAITSYTVVPWPAGGDVVATGTLSTTREITNLTRGVTYTFTVRAAAGSSIGPDSAPSNPLTIGGETPEPPVLSAAPVAIDEGERGVRVAVFDLKLSEGSAEPVRFRLATVAGTATSGSDYVAIDELVEIPAGQPGARVEVLVRGDATIETDETFSLRITELEGATLAPAPIVGTIRNDDQLQLSVADVALAEGDGGSKTALFTVRLSQAAPAAVRYSIATSNGTATAGTDYAARSLAGETIAAGKSSRTFAVTVNGDTAVEADETFGVTVSAVTGAVVARGTASGTILNDDQEPPPSLSIADVSLDEGDSGTRQATFTVRLSKPAPSPVSFAIATADGTAKAGSDYLARGLAGQQIAAGASSYVFAVAINGDTAVETDETFTVAVSGVTGATVADGSATGTIVDDDASLPPLATRDDRVVLRENAPASLIAVLANDVFTPARVAGGSLAIVQSGSGTATVDDRGTATAADDRIRYVRKADTSGSDFVRYRLCETDGRCAAGRLVVELRPAVDIAQATASGAGFVDVAMTGLRPLPAATFEATALVAPTIGSRALGVDASPESPWDLAAAGTSSVVYTLPAPADGVAQTTRLLVDAKGGGDVDLYLGVDTDGDGVADPEEVRCTAAMSVGRERCEMTLTHPGTGTVRWWAMLHNREAAAQTGTIEAFVVPLTAPADPTVFVATGPGGLPRGASFPVRVAFADVGLLPGEARVGFVRVRSGGADRGMFPVRIDRNETRSPAIRLAAKPVGLRLAVGAAQDRMFVDVPAGATSLTITTNSAQNVDLYLARATTPSSPQIDVAPARSLATASATGATGNETLVVSGAALQPGRWYVTLANAGGTAAWASVRATIAGTGPALRFGSFFNPARSGHGIFVYPAGGDWAGLWYTYLQDGSATWYWVQGPKPGSDGVFRGGLYRAAWQGTSNHLTDVGDVTITPTGTDDFVFTYRLDGETGSEAMTSLGRGCPMLSGAPLDVSSHWFNPARSGTGYSVQMWPDYEYYAAFVYDGYGVPRFLTAEHAGFGGASATMDLEQLSGFCPLCARPGNPVRQSIGVMSRRFGGGTIENITLDGIYAGGVPGAWTGNEAVQLLGGPTSTQGCTP